MERRPSDFRSLLVYTILNELLMLWIDSSKYFKVYLSRIDTGKLLVCFSFKLGKQTTTDEYKMYRLLGYLLGVSLFV